MVAETKVKYDPKEAEQAGLRRLCNAIIDDINELEFAQQKYAEDVRTMVGKHGARDGAADKVPYNTYAMAVNILVPLLAGQQPSVSVTTKYRDLQQLSLALELALPIRMRQMGYEDESRDGLVSALFAPLAVSMVGRCEAGEIPDGDEEPYSMTNPFVLPVQFENYAFDVQAKRWDQAQYESDEFEVDYEQYMDTAEISRKSRDKLQPDDRDEDEMRRSGRVVTITRSTSAREPYRKTMKLRRVWCPSSNTIKIIRNLHDPTLIDEREYVGPWEGPYKKLSFTQIPGQLLGLAPSAQWRDLTETTNMLWNKAVRQAARQKTLTGFSDEDTAERAKNAGDGQAIHIAPTMEPKEFKLGGAEQVTTGMVLLAKQLFEEISGNLPLLGGIGAASGTATQDVMLRGGANQRIADMAYAIHRWHKAKVTHIAQDLYADSMFDEPLVYRTPGTNIEFDLTNTFLPEYRWGEYIQFQLDIVPFSMTVLSPAEQMRIIEQHLQTVVIPAGQMWAQQGMQFNWRKFEQRWGKASGVENIWADMVMYSGTQKSVSAEERQSPPVTTRVNERRSGTGPTRQNGMAQIAARLLSGNGNMGGYGG